MDEPRTRSNEIEIIEPSERLLKDVLLRVHEEQGMRKARIYFILIAMVLLTSAMGLVSGILAFVQASVRSGFSEFLSLVVTDRAAIAVDWQDFAYSIMETLPVLTLIIVLTMAVAFIWSLRYVTREFKRVVGPLNFVHR